MNAGENPVVLNVTMILFLFGLMAFGWMWKEITKLPRAVVVRPPQAGRTIADSIVACLEGMQLADIHGPPLISRDHLQPVLVRTFG